MYAGDCVYHCCSERHRQLIPEYVVGCNRVCRSPPPFLDGGSFVPGTPPLVGLLESSTDSIGADMSHAVEATSPRQVARSPRTSTACVDICNKTTECEPENLVSAIAAMVKQMQHIYAEVGVSVRGSPIVGNLCLTDGTTTLVCRLGTSRNVGQDDQTASGGTRRATKPVYFAFGDSSTAFEDLTQAPKESNPRGRSRSNSYPSIKVSSKKRFKVKNPFKKRPKASADAEGRSEDDEIVAAASVLQAEANGNRFPLSHQSSLTGSSFFVTDEPSTHGMPWYLVAANSIVWCSSGGQPKARRL